MSKQTLTVDGIFGEKEVDREEYIKQWVDHVKQLHRLSYQEEDQAFIQMVIKRTGQIAEKEFDRAITEQNKVA